MIFPLFLFRANCKTALLLNSNCTFTLIFSSLHRCPHFLNLNAKVAPALSSLVHGVNSGVKGYCTLWIHECTTEQTKSIQNTAHRLMDRKEIHRCWSSSTSPAGVAQ